MQKTITLPVWTCKRCNHEWIGKSQDKPTICPKCKTPYWDRPRKEKEVKDESR